MRRLPGLVWLLIPALAAGQESPVFQWLRDVAVPEITAATPAAAPLDSHFFQFTRPGRPDVRVRNERDESVGYIIRTASDMKARSIRSTWIAEQTAAKVDAADGLQIEIRLRDKEPPPNGIRIITPLRDFEHQIRIESSSDGMEWQFAGPPTVIFDYSRYVDARNDLVPLATTEHRRFRVTIDDVTAEQELQLLELHRHLRGGEETDRTEGTAIVRRPFRVDRIEFYRDDAKNESSKTRLTAYPSAEFQATNNEKQQTMVTFATQREPVTEIKIITTAENFSRAATVEAELEDANGKMTWRKAATGTLTRFAVGAIRREDLTLVISETGALRYRVAIENGDNPPLAVTGVELSGPLYELTFLASPGQKLQLEYGSPTAPGGRFDTAALQAALSQDQPAVIAALQPPRANPEATEGAGRRWNPWNDNRFLVGAILALTVLLSWMLFRASRRIQLPPEN